MAKWLMGIALLICTSVSCAAGKPYEVFGKYKVYFSVFNSSFITPAIAQTYNITRGKDRAIINIAIIESSTSGDTVGLPAVVKGEVANLMQQQRKLGIYRDTGTERRVLHCEHALYQ